MAYPIEFNNVNIEVTEGRNPSLCSIVVVNFQKAMQSALVRYG